MYNLFNKQRGAMFGIDARLMLAIFSGLSVVTGLSMAGILTGSKATGVSKDVETITNAIASIQQDFGGPIHTISGSSGAKNLIALFDLDTAYISTADQDKWLGPYIEELPIDSGYAQNRFYGRMTLEMKQKNKANNCSTSDYRPCYYWLTIAKVPDAVAEKFNNQVDGTSEGSNANTNGNVRWDTYASGHASYATLGPNHLWVRVGAAIKR